MNGADFLRGIFGFRNPRFPSDGQNESQENPQDGLHFSWRGTFSSDPQEDLFGCDRVPHDEGIPRDIFSHFDEIFRQMDQLFSPGFGRTPFESLPGIPSNEEDQPSGTNPRDYMLKQPFDDPPAERQPHTDSITPPGFFGSIFRPTFENRKKEDTDNNPEPSPESPSMNSVAPMPEGNIDRVQVYTYTNLNGSKEVKRSYRDETGAVVTTVTRSLGPQQYSNTTKTLPDGRKEHTEDFINMSDAEKENFKRKWSDHAQGQNLNDGKHITQYFKDLFRLGFPGFPPK